MQEEYIELLLKRCTKLEKGGSLFIHYSKEIQPFIEKLLKEVAKKRVEDIYLDCYDISQIHDALKNNSIEEIKKLPLFDCSVWDTYASKQASFLIFETEYPHFFDDIDVGKIAAMSRRQRETKPLYYKLVTHCQLAWSIVAYPGECWAKHLFTGEDAYRKLEEAIYKICMLNQENPIKCWDDWLEITGKRIKKLNSLNLQKLHYSNSLGTSLTVYLPKKYCFGSAWDNDMIVNLPSYEVFASPIYNKTEGVVYASKPLNYNGSIIDKFYLEFKNGKVVNYGAEEGSDLLREILTSDDYSSYLGECALVEKDSSIASLNMTFETTLIDENASCHLALGAGFPECIEGGLLLTDNQLLKRGINPSNYHVDFMIGTDDMQIIGTDYFGKEYLIFENGKFPPDLVI